MTDDVSFYATPGLLKRLLAICYDALLVFALLFIAAALVMMISNKTIIEPNTPWFTAYLLTVCFLFFGWFWTHGGQTLGMRSWRIRLVQRDGTAVTWSQALLRFGAAIVSWLVFGLGFLWVIVDRERLSWHDRASGTRLIVLPKQTGN